MPTAKAAGRLLEQSPSLAAPENHEEPKAVTAYDTTNRAYSCNKRRCGLLATTVIAAAAVLGGFASLILLGMAYEAAPALTICVLCPVAVAATLRELRRWSAER